MKIDLQREGENLTVRPDGPIDTMIAPELEKAIKDNMEGVSNLRIDFSDVDYISSAGLRVLLMRQKEMDNKGSMTIFNVSDDVKETLEIVGLLDFLTVE